MQRVDAPLIWRTLAVPLVWLIVSVCLTCFALVATVMAWCDFVVPFGVWPAPLLLAASGVFGTLFALSRIRFLLARVCDIWELGEMSSTNPAVH